jgi:hypothetical protein
MPEPTRLSIRVSAESHGRKTHISRLFTLDVLISWIRRLELDDYTISGLIALASKYPAAALPSFRKNINLMIHRVRLQRQKDQEGESNAKERPKRIPIDNQVFDAGPQRVSITEEDLRDEWEGDGERECVIAAPQEIGEPEVQEQQEEIDQDIFNETINEEISN